jgi:hypothetical protein
MTFRIRSAALGLLLLARLATPSPAAAEEKGGSRDTPKRDPLFSIETGGGDWSAIRVPFGCFLVAPREAGGENIVIGQHRDYGLGMALVGLGLSQAPTSQGEPVTISAGGRDLPRRARLVAQGVMFIALDAQDMSVALREIWVAGTLWMTLRDTSFAQGGRNAQKALESYSRICAPGGQ